MNLAVTNLVQKDGRATLPAAKLRDQMMQALRNVRWDRPTAEAAYGDGIFHGPKIGRLRHRGKDEPDVGPLRSA